MLTNFAFIYTPRSQLCSQLATRRGDLIWRHFQTYSFSARVVNSLYLGFRLFWVSFWRFISGKTYNQLCINMWVIVIIIWIKWKWLYVACGKLYWRSYISLSFVGGPNLLFRGILWENPTFTCVQIFLEVAQCCILGIFMGNNCIH